MKAFLQTFFFCLLLTQSFAQPIISMLDSNPILKEAIYERMDEVDSRSAVTLPFYDDFSYDGPYTSLEYWIGNSTFVNDNFAIDKPSVGVATFDGLNGAGEPYGGGHGGADTLMSQEINLGGLTSTDNVNLSFYIEAGGLGYAPATNDEFLIEFKKEDGTWTLISQYQPGSNNEFSFKLFSISDPVYLYDGFQFRFINFCSRLGMGELWHLDYVRLQKDIIASETYKDIAFSKVPSSLLNNYTAIPKYQFEGNEGANLSNMVNINIYNHFENTNDVQNTSLTVTELNSGTPLLNVGLLNGAQADIPTGSNTVFDNSILNFGDLESSMSAVSNGNDALLIESKYSFNVGEENSSINSVINNNTVRSTVAIDDYFAYDDGTAEAGIACGNSSNQIAVKFTAFKTDTLFAVGMHIPHITNNVSSQQFNLKVWIGELDNTPEYEGFLLSPELLGYDVLDGFAPYVLFDEFNEGIMPLVIPAGDFYVGWQQVGGGTNDKIPVGLDYNTDASDNCFFAASSTSPWVNFGAQFDGSLMLRPFFDLPETVSNSNLSVLEDNIKIYPNPTEDIVNIVGLENMDNVVIHVLSLDGRLVFQTQNTTSFNLPTSLPNGVYLIRIQTKEGIVLKKLVKAVR